MSTSIADAQIKETVLSYLKTADMSVTTERNVLAHVQTVLQLDRPVAEYKRLVSSTIDEYLESLPAEEEEEEEEEPPEKDTKKRGSRKRGADDGGKVGAKKARGGGGPDDVIHSASIGSKRKARVKRYNGKLYVDVREFNEHNGEETASYKGLTMDPGQWFRLVRELPRQVEVLRAGRQDAPATQLSQTRLAQVSVFKGSAYLGLREYYEKDGQLAPGKKGINLTASEAEALLAAAPALTATLGGDPDYLEPLPPALPIRSHGAESEAAPREAAPRRAAPVAAPAPVPAAPGPSGGSGGGGGGAAEAKEMVELGQNKRVRLNRFSGRLSVDLREFYEKDGEKLPGKKGISLPPDDWNMLTARLSDISNALNRGDMSYVLELAGRRRVTLSEFRGVKYVGVREYYDKGGGEMAPGAKGLSMNPQQWAALVAGAPSITAALAKG